MVVVTNDDGKRHTATTFFEDDPETSEWVHDVRLAKLATDVGNDVAHVVRDLMEHNHPEPPPDAGDRDWLN